MDKNYTIQLKFHLSNGQVVTCHNVLRWGYDPEHRDHPAEYYVVYFFMDEEGRGGIQRQVFLADKVLFYDVIKVLTVEPGEALTVEPEDEESRRERYLAHYFL